MYDKLIKPIFLAAVIFCPLMFFTDVTRNPYAIQSVVFQILISIALLLSVLKFRKEKNIILAKTELDKPLAVFFIFCALTAANAFLFDFPRWKLAILSFAGRNLIFLILNAIALFYITVQYFREKKERKKILGAVFIAATIASLYGILQYFGIEIIWSAKIAPYGARSVSTFGNPNFMSSYLILVIPVIFVLVLHEKSLKMKLAMGTLGIINTLGLFVTQTRSSWLGLFVTLTIIAAVMIKSQKKVVSANKKWLILLAVMFIIIVLIPFRQSGTSGTTNMLSQLAGRIDSIRNINQGSYTQRFLMWSAALSMFSEHPLLGVGAGNYEILYPSYQARFLKIKMYAPCRTHSNNTHNEILEIITQLGLVGFGLYIWLFYIFFKKTIEIYRNTADEQDRIMVLGLGASIVGMFVDNMLNVSLHFPMPAIPFWINIGIIFSIGISGKNDAFYKINLKKEARFFIALLAAMFALFVIILNIRSFMGEVHYFDGFKKARQGDLQSAIKECLLSYKLYPLNVDNNYELGNAYARLEYKDKAAWAYKAAIAANPGYDEIYFNLGVIYGQAKLFDKALEMLNESLTINPLFRETYVNLGNIYIQKKMWLDAIKAYRDCLNLQLGGDEQMLRQNLAYALTQLYVEGQDYIDKKDWTGALKLFEGLVQLLPEDAKAHLYLGNIYFIDKRMKDSIAQYRKVLELTGDNDVSIINNLGLAYMETNELDAAEKQFSKALKIAPENTVALKKLVEIRNMSKNNH